MTIPTFGTSAQGQDGNEEIRVLTPADIGRLSLRNHPRLSEGDAEALVIQAPGLSMWHPESREFILVTPWRHRQDIPTVHVASAFRHEDELLSASIRAAEEQGKAGFVVLELQEIRRPSFYERNGLERLESIVTYEMRQPQAFLRTISSRRQDFVQLDWRSGELARAVIEVDHEAFPWLWWNSAEEFSSYIALPNIEVWAGMHDGEVVSYVGFTQFRGWSHLDRIAIRPAMQGQGFGREALHFAIERMVQLGARRVGLSTQGTNARSRRLYETIGFRATPEHHYDVYGVIFPEGRKHYTQGA